MTASHDFLPNFFILGAAKCGTTNLHTHLNTHPEICMSSPKEPLFLHCEYQKGLRFCKTKYFSNWKGEPIIGESAHRNLYLPYVAERLYRLNSLAKCLVILRNPIDRAYSHWRHTYYYKQDHLDFPAAVREDMDRIQSGNTLSTKEEQDWNCKVYRRDRMGIYRTYIDSGYYYQQIQRYLQFFASNQILILLLEDVIKRPRRTYLRIQSFLNTKIRVESNILSKKTNQAGVILPGNPLYYMSKSGMNNWVPEKWKRLAKKKLQKLSSAREMDRTTRQLLRDHYRPHNQKLSELLNRDLSHWK